METGVQQYKMPTVVDLFNQGDSLDVAYKGEALNALLSNQPNPKWVKEHPFVKGYKYLPIDKVEYLLRRIFKRYRIEILNESVAFNGVVVRVRVHYFNPVFAEWDFHDGIGAVQLQTKKDTSPADLININNGAISMAFPIAKTMAIKDACDHFGELFGCNLNRKDTLPFIPDEKLTKLTVATEGLVKEIAKKIEAGEWGAFDAAKSKGIQFDDMQSDYLNNLVKTYEAAA